MEQDLLKLSEHPRFLVWFVLLIFLLRVYYIIVFLLSFFFLAMSLSILLRITAYVYIQIPSREEHKFDSSKI